MTLLVFPTFSGVSFPVGRSILTRTIVEESTSGKEYRVQLWTFPRRKYSLPFNILGDGSINGFTNTDLSALESFILNLGGMANPFHFNDLKDNTIGSASAPQILGIGDGVTTSFSLQRNRGAITATATIASGSPNLSSVSNTVNAQAGMKVWGPGIPIGTTVVSFTSSTIAMSANATINGTAQGISVGGFVEPTQDMNALTNIYTYAAGSWSVVSGANYSVTADPNYGCKYAVNFNSAPANGTPVGAAFSYYWPCRFTADTQEFSNMMTNIWELKKLEFETLKVI